MPVWILQKGHWMRKIRLKETQKALGEGAIDRRGLLKCMTWIGTGLIWTVSGGVPSSRLAAF